MDIEGVAAIIVDSAIKVHKSLGPGLLESAYQQCLAIELKKRNLRVDSEIPLPLIYEGHRVESAYRVDMVVENLVLIENKCAEILLPIHKAQVLTYLKLSGYRLGFLLNWNVRRMKDGINRLIFDYSWKLE